MTLVEKLFALKTTPPFDRLRDTELALVASAAGVREFAPDEVIHPGTDPFPRFYLLASGTWCGPGPTLPRTLGAGSLLYGHAAPGTITAGPEGAVCLTIAQTHFHTVANECPDLLLGYIAGETASTPTA